MEPLKARPKRKLAGLAAREVTGGAKVILPVWHDVDHDYLAARTAILADRVGASTKHGIDAVADRALRAAHITPMTEGSEALLQSVTTDAGAAVGVPRDALERARLVAGRPGLWEHRFFASVQHQGRRDLEPKWRDNALRLGSGPRRHISDESALEEFRREVGWVRE